MLTGFNLQAACILLPLATSIYTAAGGLRATVIASYTHSIVVYVVIIFLVIKVLGACGKGFSSLCATLVLEVKILLV